MLSETETIWMLDFPGTCVAEDSEIAEGIKEKNQRYDEVCTHSFTLYVKLTKIPCTSI